MTLQITDREDFKDKFAALLAANVSMITAGAPLNAELAGDLIDHFLDQFVATTPAPAAPRSAGYIVVMPGNGSIPYDFRGHLYANEDLALLGIENFLANKDYGKPSDYRIVEAMYYG